MPPYPLSPFALLCTIPIYRSRRMFPFSSSLFLRLRSIGRLDITHIASSLFLQLRSIVIKPSSFFAPTLPLSLLIIHSIFLTANFIHTSHLVYISCTTYIRLRRLELGPLGRLSLRGLPLSGTPVGLPPSRVFGCLTPHWILSSWRFLCASGSPSKRALGGYEYYYSHCQTSGIDVLLRRVEIAYGDYTHPLAC